MPTLTAQHLRNVADGIGPEQVEYTCIAVGKRDSSARAEYVELCAQAGVPVYWNFGRGQMEINGGVFYAKDKPYDRDAADTWRFDFLNLLAHSLDE